MSSNDVQVLTLPLGGFNGATELPLAKLPDDYGGITVIEANMTGAAGTAIGALLIKMTDAGTPVLSGTIGSFAGTVVTAAGVVFEATISTPYVAAGSWIGYDQTSGTVPAGSFITVSYVTGK
jgi:hypothetical protein